MVGMRVIPTVPESAAARAHLQYLATHLIYRVVLGCQEPSVFRAMSNTRLAARSLFRANLVKGMSFQGASEALEDGDFLTRLGTRMRLRDDASPVRHQAPMVANR
jgi:hypothetical protein